MKIGKCIKFLLILLLVYISIVVFLFFYQRKLLYHPSENNYLDEMQLNHKIKKHLSNQMINLFLGILKKFKI